MDKKQVRAGFLNISSGLNSYGVKSLSLFGSVANGTAKDDSDIDFLVEFDGPATFDRYMGVQELLEHEFHTKIDLVTLRALKPLLREQILHEAVKVA